MFRRKNLIGKILHLAKLGKIIKLTIKIFVFIIR